ncbi:MAG: IclR family transcriptional regulator [Zoogloeaceae bacterium]|jgi:DNA-binding IclR family transcriptional regulator|nr:IclR family transcriptional regulator [Zoogloeaceae bacterium]
MSAYTNDAQQRLIKLILLMFGDVVQGFPPSTLARELGCAPAVMTRDLANLLEAGIAVKNEQTGLWKLTPRLPQQAIKVFTAIDRAERELAETKARFIHQPMQ